MQAPELAWKACTQTEGQHTNATTPCGRLLRCWAQVGSHRLHSAPITTLVLHPTSCMLATADAEGCIRVWDMHELLHCTAGHHAAAQRASFAHNHSVAACCFSSCGGFLASCSAQDATIRLWSVGRGEALAVLRLRATCVAFQPGDDAALLVAADDPAGPLLLDLWAVPACRQFCEAVAAAQAPAHHGSSDRRGGGQELQAPAAALHPAAAMWLPPASTAPVAPSSGAALPAASTPGPQERGPVVAVSQATASQLVGHGSAACRRPGSMRSSGRRRRRRQLEAEEGETEVWAAAEAAAGGAPGASADDSSANVGRGSGGLPGGHSRLALQPPALTWASWAGWGAPQCPLSPSAAPLEDDCVPAAAVMVRYRQPSSSGDAEWDASTGSFVHRQGGHTMPPHMLLPLPTALHVTTLAADGEAKLWPLASSSCSSSGSAVCCTMLPAAGDCRKGPWLLCRPAVSCDGRFMLHGSPSGTLACWDLREQQRQAHLPLNRKLGNAAAASRWSHMAVTAVAVGLGDTCVVCGDAAGRLLVRWR